MRGEKFEIEVEVKDEVEIEVKDEFFLIYKTFLETEIHLLLKGIS